MISVELKGRFGNHLFQYVTCRVMAERNGFSFSIPNGTPIGDKSVNGGWLGKKLFNCELGVKYEKQHRVFKEKNNSFTPEIFNISDNTHLDGWWQSEKYFEGYRDKIREWFNIEDREIDPTTCIIHLRAQDGYLSDNFVLPTEFFNRAKEFILSKNPNITFTIITDNPRLANKYFPKDNIISGDMENDFRIIKSSKYKIISNSSFSWWAAWLGLPNSKIVIAPERWMNYNFNKSKENIFYPRDIKTKKFIYL